MTLVLITTGAQLYREYLLRSIGARYRVHLLSGTEPDWQRDYIAGWSPLSDLTETVDADEMIAAVRALGEPVDGVLAWDEARVLQCAKVAAALGLPGGDVAAAMRCRDKHQTRSALRLAGVPQARSALVADPDEALTAAAAFGYPVILKPRAMAASLGVIRVDSAAELRARFGFVRDITLPGAWRYPEILVEEYLTGPEISVDAAVHQGQVVPFCVAHKEVGFAPYFEETGHLVDAADPLLSDPVLQGVLADTHTALGFTDGMTHTELRLTADGPKVIEVNARLGGDLIPYLGRLASGIDPGLLAAAIACGERPDVIADHKRVAAVRFFYPDRDDTLVDALDVDPESLPEAIDRFALAARPGDLVSPPPKGNVFDRIGFATAVADTAAECQAALDVAAELGSRACRTW